MKRVHVDVADGVFGSNWEETSVASLVGSFHAFISVVLEISLDL